MLPAMMAKIASKPTGPNPRKRSAVSCVLPAPGPSTVISRSSRRPVLPSQDIALHALARPRRSGPRRSALSGHGRLAPRRCLAIDRSFGLLPSAVGVRRHSAGSGSIGKDVDPAGLVFHAWIWVPLGRLLDVPAGGLKIPDQLPGLKEREIHAHPVTPPLL